MERQLNHNDHSLSMRYLRQRFKLGRTVAARRNGAAIIEATMALKDCAIKCTPTEVALASCYACLKQQWQP